MTEEFDFGAMLDKFRHSLYGDFSFRVICPNCGEPVKADDSIDIGTDGNFINQPNATCVKCGRIEMPFDGTIIKPFGQQAKD